MKRDSVLHLPIDDPRQPSLGLSAPSLSASAPIPAALRRPWFDQRLNGGQEAEGEAGAAAAPRGPRRRRLRGLQEARPATEAPPIRRRGTSLALCPLSDCFLPSNSDKDESFALSQLISSDLSSKILKEAINQQKEILQEAEEENRTPFSAVSVDPSVASDSDAEDAGAFDDFSETQSQYDVDEVSCFCPVFFALLSFSCIGDCIELEICVLLRWRLTRRTRSSWQHLCLLRQVHSPHWRISSFKGLKRRKRRSLLVGVFSFVFPLLLVV